MKTRSKPIVEKMSEEQLLQQIENLEKKLAARDKENFQIRAENNKQRTKINDLKNQNAYLKSQIQPETKDIELQTESNSDSSRANSQVGFQALFNNGVCTNGKILENPVHCLQEEQYYSSVLFYVTVN